MEITIAIELNIGLKQPEGLEWNLESFSEGKIWEFSELRKILFKPGSTT
jgi:hypothetical protein